MAGSVDLASYCVLYVDVLGQGDLLDQLTDLPRTPAEKARTVRLLRKTIGFLLQLRKWFKDFFEAYAEESPWAAQLPSPQRMALRQLLNHKVDMQSFSDSIVVSVSLLDDGSSQCTQMNSVFAMMLAACGMHLFSLSVQKATRGGIDIGLGTRLETGEPYGAALVRAVRLEQHAAEYPRIVAGHSLLDYLKTVREPPLLAQMAKQVAERAQSLVFEDTDGLNALDFMGAEVRNASEPTNAIDTAAIARALDFVSKEITRFASEDCPKLLTRYQSLKRYMDSRTHIWGVPSGPT